MKDKTLMYVCIILVLIVSTTIAIKYNNIKLAYQTAEKERVDYCEKYYHQKDLIEDLEYELQMQDSVIQFLNDDNQILSSFLAEMEN